MKPNKSTIRAATNRSDPHITQNGVCVLDLNLRITNFNNAFYRQVRKIVQKQITRGENLRLMLSRSLGESHVLHTSLLRIIKSGLSQQQYRWVDDAGLYYYDIAILHVLDTELTASGYIITVHDATIEKQIEEKLNTQVNALQHANQDLDRFLYSVSHDLRAPILSMQGLINNLKSEIATNAGSQTILQYVDFLERSVSRIDNFTSDVTKYTINAQSEKRIQLVDLEVIIHTSLESLAFLDGFEHVQKSLKITDNSPVLSDPIRLSIIFDNLFSNAIQYRNTAHPNPCMNVTIEIKKELITIIIEDNGIGIEHEFQELVFEKFTRFSTQSTGSGLGLFVVKKTIDLLGGNIILESTSGIGTTFTLQIPNHFN